MLSGLWAIFLGSPLKLALWIGNRLLTWTGLLLLWQRSKRSPERWRRFLVLGTALNAASLLLLGWVIYRFVHR